MLAHSKLFLFQSFFAFRALLLMTCLTFSAWASQATTSPSQTSLDKFQTLLIKDPFQPSEGEMRVANNLAKIYEITDKGYINIELTKKALKQTRNYSAFHVYIDWLESIIKIHSNSSSNSLKKTCSSLVLAKPENQIKERLVQKSASMCFNQYLRLLAKKPTSLKIHRKEMDFFSKNISSIATAAHRDSLVFFLSRFKNNSSALKSYSSSLSSHYMKLGKAPEKRLLQYMTITPELTAFIQAKGLDDGAEKWVFYRELKKLVKKAFNAADKGLKEEQILPLLVEALQYYQLSYPQLPQRKSDDSILSLGKSLVRRGHFKSARRAFNAIAHLNPNDENIKFETMWTWLTQEKYKKAYQEVIEKHKLHENYQSLKDDRLQFWTAFTLKQLENKKDKEIFENLISKSALNYYSIIASKLLGEHYKIPSQQIYYKFANQEAMELEKLPKLDSASKQSLKRLKIWAGTNFEPFIDLEYQNLFKVYSRVIADKNSSHDLDQTKATMLLLAAEVFKSEENYLESFKIIYRGLNNHVITLNETVMRILFPKPFEDQILSQGQSFDPLIALSLIRQESCFNRKAKSWVGARGLMQLMPNTAKMYWKGIKTTHLYNPKINIKIGSKYLSMLLEKYDNNLVFALSAYNAGESRVKKWRKEYLNENHSILHNIENIPFPETRKYVKLIFRNLFFYKMLDQKHELADSKKVNEIFDVQLGFNQE